MTNENVVEAAAKVLVEEEILKEQQKRQEEEIKQAREMMAKAAETSAGRREKEEKVAEEVKKITDEKIEAELQEKKTTEAEARLVEKEVCEKLAEKCEQARKEASAALDLQREIAMKEKVNCANNHSKSMLKQMEDMKMEEKRADEKIKVEKEKEAEIREQFHREKMGYVEESMAKNKAHCETIIQLKEKQSETLLDREEGRIQHREHMGMLMELSGVHENLNVLAKIEDQKEMTFVNAVNTVRNAGSGLMTAIPGLTSLSVSFQNNFSLEERVVNKSKCHLEEARQKLAVLEDCVAVILEENGISNDDVAECQKAARRMQVHIRSLTEQLDAVSLFLAQNLTKKHNSVAFEVVKEIRKVHGELSSEISHLKVKRTNNFEKQNARNIDAVKSLHLGTSTVTVAVKEIEGSEEPVIEEAPEDEEEEDEEEEDEEHE